MMINKLLEALGGCSAGGTCSHPKSPRAKEAYAFMQRGALKGAMDRHIPTRNHPDVFQIVVPTRCRRAIHERLRRLFPEYKFGERDVQIRISKPSPELTASAKEAHTIVPQMVFPRFEVLILGKLAPLSGCCAQPLFIDFDVVDGALLSCSKRGCAGPILYMADDPNGFRVRLWGPWIRFYGGVLPPMRTHYHKDGMKSYQQHSVKEVAAQPEDADKILSIAEDGEASEDETCSPVSHQAVRQEISIGPEHSAMWVSKGWSVRGDVQSHVNRDSILMEEKDEQAKKPKVLNLALEKVSWGGHAPPPTPTGS